MTPFDTLLAPFVFLFGIIVGSFLNVVLFRTEKGGGFGGRSHCMSCDITLGTRDLVPVISYFFLRGRCRNCDAPISIQYPLVELTMGTLALLLLTLNLSLPAFFTLFVIAAYLLLITVYDIRHTEIPNSFAYGFCYFALLYAFLPLLTSFDFLNPAFLVPPAFFAGPIVFVAFFLLWDLSEERAIGLADAKIALGMGWLLGLGGAVNAILIAVWSGAATGILLLAAPKAVAPLGKILSLWRKSKAKNPKYSFKSEIPFAPFLVIGTVLVLFTNIDVLHLFW
jgi:leader peptidase (prepilin peptidase)/N-methyltransferase